MRLLLIRAGFPRPETQIPVCDEYGQLVAELDVGWRDAKVGVDYDGSIVGRVTRAGHAERDATAKSDRECRTGVTFAN